MNGRWVASCIGLILCSLAVLSCASVETAYHRYFMRGSIISLEGNDAYICVGRRDGATPGQVLIVQRWKVRPASRGISAAKIGVGTVRIEELYDEHFARASIMSGAVQLHDTVELELR